MIAIMIAMRMHAGGIAATFVLAAGLLVDDRCAADVADSERRPYVTGMIGSSLAPAGENQAGGSVDQAPLGGFFTGSMLNGEGAIGVAIARPGGGWRVEFEGRHRAVPTLADELWTSQPAAADVFRTAVGNEWSTMANAWRDLRITDHFGGYLGGGIGIGGCTYGFTGSRTEGGVVEPVTGSGRLSGFAWQVGGGLTYALTDRITCDVGYRFHEIEPTGSGRRVSGAAAAGGGSPLRLSAGEVVFAVRIYEPFQGWLRSPVRRAGDVKPHALAGSAE